jgi:hypothetical protein
MNRALHTHRREPLRDALAQLAVARRYAKGNGFPVLAAKLELAIEQATSALTHLDDMSVTP